MVRGNRRSHRKRRRRGFRREWPIHVVLALMPVILVLIVAIAWNLLAPEPQLKTLPVDCRDAPPIAAELIEHRFRTDEQKAAISGFTLIARCRLTNEGRRTLTAAAARLRFLDTDGRDLAEVDFVPPTNLGPGESAELSLFRVLGREARLERAVKAVVEPVAPELMQEAAGGSSR